MKPRRQPKPGPEPDTVAKGQLPLEQLLGQVSDCLWQGTVGSDDKLRVHFVSPAWTKLSGYTPEQLYKEPSLWFDRILKDDRSLAQAALHAALRDSKPQVATYRVLDGQGVLRWIEDLMTAEVQPAGVVRVHGIARDITHRKQHDARTLQLERHSMLSHMAAGIAHDFNNLLLSILGRAALLRHDCDDPVMRHELSEIERTTRFAEELCKHLLAYTGQAQLEKRAEDMQALLRESVGLLRLVAGASLRIELQLDAEQSWIRADRVQLRQILLNLVRNAAEAGAKHVRLRTAEVALSGDEIIALDGGPNLAAGDFVLLRVEDDGTGFNAEIAQHLFEPFFSTKGMGRGLGLSTVRGMMLAHGGAVGCASPVGRGSSFSLYFPAIEAPQPVEAPPPKLTSPQLRGASVLLVDDDEAVLEITQRMLQLLGFTMQLARDSQGALALAEGVADRFQLAIVDAGLGQDDGIELAIALRRRHPELPVLLMSGLDRREDLETALGRSPSIGFLLKPFAPQELLARISELLLR